jgi:protein-tyrosine-phosphatase
MAEGLLRSIAGDRFEVESAGVDPSSVRPEAIEGMHEIGIDISHQKSKSVEQFVNERFDFVITVCDNAKESCPVFPNAASESIKASKIRRRLEPRRQTKPFRSFAVCVTRYAIIW